MRDRFSRFLDFQRQIEDLLKEDHIESALAQLLEYIESNHSYIMGKVPKSMSIGISATVSRVKQAYLLGFIDWNLASKQRSRLVEECMVVLDILYHEAENGHYESKKHPFIGISSNIYLLHSTLKGIEDILVPSTKA